MKCVQCGKSGLVATTVTHDVHVGDQVVRGVVPADTCRSCGETYVRGDALERLELQVAEIVARSGRVGGETFRFLRKSLGLQARDLQEITGTPPETISRWETGQRPTDRFAWVTLATMVLDTVARRSETRAVLRATFDPSGLPRQVEIE